MVTHIKRLIVRINIFMLVHEYSNEVGIIKKKKKKSFHHFINGVKSRLETKYEVYI